MRRRSSVFFSASTIFGLCGVVLVAPLSPSYATRGTSIVLRPVQQNMPIAKSGQPYTFNLGNSVTGGTKPYKCTPRALNVGSLKMTKACVITGIAPKVSIESITGPFTFKVTDSAKPLHTLLITGVNVVTKAVSPSTPKPTPSASSTDKLFILVTKIGDGSGSVIADSGNIDCGTVCKDAYVGGTLVTLAATPDPGFRFSGWSGACEGIADCVLNVTADMTVTATFNIDISGTYSGTDNLPKMNPPGTTGCEATVIDWSVTLQEASGGKITGTTAGGSQITGTRVGNTITVTENTNWGLRGPYVWQLNGKTLTGTAFSSCTDIATGALVNEGTASFSLNLP